MELRIAREQQASSADEESGRAPKPRWLVLTVACLIYIGSVLYHMAHTSETLVEATALEEGAQISEALGAVRSLYTSEVVHRLESHGIRATHDYRQHAGEIPLPATLTHMLGEQLAQGSSGIRVRLFSADPFPWRADRTLDAFEREALERIRARPSEPVHRVEEIEGVTWLRYASADIMGESCVACHNEHPLSPRRDWKVGDVRGVLLVSRPLRALQAQLQAHMVVQLLVVLGLALLLAASCAWSFGVRIPQLDPSSRGPAGGSDGQPRSLLQRGYDRFGVLAIASIVFAIDLRLPAGVAASIPYVVLVLFSPIGRRGRGPLSTAVLGSILTVLGFALSSPSTAVWVALENRLLTLFGIWTTAFLCMRQKRIIVHQERVAFGVRAAQVAAENLRRQEQHERAILDSSLDPLIVIDEFGCVQRASRSTERVFGWSCEELVGKNVSMLMPEPYRSQHDAYLTRYREHGGAGLVCAIRDVEGRRRDGSVFPCELGVAAVSSPTSEKLLLGTLRDLSARKQLELQLAEARKLECVGQLAAGIAHEINTPAQYVGDNLKFIRDSLDELFHLLGKESSTLALDSLGSDELRKLLEARESIELDYLSEEVPTAIAQSIEGIERIATIVRAMKEFSHPGQKTSAWGDLNRAIKSTVTVARNEWKHVAEMQLELDPELPQVQCVLGEINQVLLNLIVNASQAIAESRGEDEPLGWIRLRSWHDDTSVIIEVSDSGPGIPADVRGRVFDPFFTTKEVGKGTGQGLALAYHTVVDVHGGSLRCENGPEGGAVFTLQLPITGRKGGPHRDRVAAPAAP